MECETVVKDIKVESSKANTVFGEGVIILDIKTDKKSGELN